MFVTGSNQEYSVYIRRDEKPRTCMARLEAAHIDFAENGAGPYTCISSVARFGAEVGLREVRVSLSRMWCVLCTLCLCVWSAHVQRVVGPVSCHVEATFSRRAARVGADVKDGERCV